jgi:hypothetical protein
MSDGCTRFPPVLDFDDFINSFPFVSEIRNFQSTYAPNHDWKMAENGFAIKVTIPVRPTHMK